MPRPHTELLHAWQREPVALVAAGWPAGATLEVLSDDPESGALDAVVCLPSGYRRSAGRAAAATELYVLDGVLLIGGEACGPGWFEWRPAGAAVPDWSSPQGARLLLMSRTGPLDVEPGPGHPMLGHAVDAARLEWATTTIPGPPDGAYLKVLRHDPATGEAVFLLGCVPRWDYPALEYHDVVETAYCIAGDIRLGNSGLMTAGSYFWRPPYVTHGPFFSETGFLGLLYGDGPIVNHYVDDPRRTVEENRAEALAQGQPVDHLAELAGGAR